MNGVERVFERDNNCQRSHDVVFLKWTLVDEITAKHITMAYKRCYANALMSGLFGADNPNAPALGTPLPGHAASRPTAATMPKDDALFHVEYTAPLCRKLSTCQAHLRKLRVEEVKGHRLSATARPTFFVFV